ncbi:ATP-binding protein [Isoptericola sp. G70]|uniref:ATP-binding protein n=1 Tax=Isoptericola sp. G70 TaxID=3376633 RepID=UPI003A7F83F2
MAYIKRIADRLVAERLRSAGAVLIEGPRACGKTSTARQHAASAVYFQNDDAARAALDVDPQLVLAGATPRLVDEWQVDATRLWNGVRATVDDRGKPGQFILTGSAVPDDDARRHTGAGRFARVEMRPMSLAESGESSGAMSLRALLDGDPPIPGRSDLSVPDLARLVVRGGWPLHLSMDEVAAAQASSDYLASIADTDLGRLDTSRRDPARAGRLLHALARNTAMELVVDRLTREVDGPDGAMARTTVYDYLADLRRLMVLQEQPAWSPRLRSRARLRTRPRVHLVDPSLAAAAWQADADRLLADLNTFGLLFESLVVRDLRAYADALDARVFHYRDSDNLEIDAVVQRRDGVFGAFEVKLGAGQVDAAAAALLRFAAKLDAEHTGGPAVLGVITGSEYGYVRPDGVVVVPLGMLGA